MYPTLAKDERTNNDGSKNERREGFVYIQKRLTPFPPFKAPSRERDTHKPCVGWFLAPFGAVLQGARTSRDKDNCTAECMFRTKLR